MVTKELQFKIEKIVKEIESTTSCEFKVAIETRLSIIEKFLGWTPRKRAESLFVKEKVWDTELNNGILIYLLLKKHALEIVTDRGIAGEADQVKWKELCTQFERSVQSGGLDSALVELIGSIGLYCAERYPLQGVKTNQLSNEVVIL